MKRTLLIILALLIVVSSLGCSATVAPIENPAEATRITLMMINQDPGLKQALAIFDQVVGSGDFRLFTDGRSYFMWIQKGKDIMLVFLNNVPKGDLEIGPSSLMKASERELVRILNGMKFYEITDKTLYPTVLTAAMQTAKSFVDFLTIMSNAEFVPLIIPVTPDMLDPLHLNDEPITS